MTARILYPTLIGGALLSAGQLLAAEPPTFAELLARAEAQAAAGHRWSPPGDNMTETVAGMMDLIPTATPKQLAELSALLESDSARPMPKTPDSPPAASLRSPEPQPAKKPDTAPLPPLPAPNATLATPKESKPAPPAPAEVRPAPLAPAATENKPPPATPPQKEVKTAPLAPPAPAEVKPAPIAPAATENKPRPATPPQKEVKTAPLAPPEIKEFKTPPAAPPQQEAKAPSATAAAPSTTTAAPPPKETKSAPTRPTQHALELRARGQEAERQGDVSGARRLYASAANGGDAVSARNAGRLYDPSFLKQFAMGGIDPDPELARKWYQRAVAMGDAEAGPLLEALAVR